MHFIDTTFRSLLRTVLLAGLIGMPLIGAAADHPSLKQAINLPPSADLSYEVHAKQSGMQVEGSATIKWHTDGSKFSISSEMRAMIMGKMLSSSSEGGVDDFGLAPNVFTEKRIRKPATTATFDRAAKTISFSGSTDTYPLIGGEQDRTSIVWQLIAQARAAPKKFIAGSEWQYFVAGQHDAETWTFKVGKTEKITTPAGAYSAIKVTRSPLQKGKGQQLDIWLAPSLDWYPVRLRLSENDGDYIEQSLDSVSRK